MSSIDLKSMPEIATRNNNPFARYFGEFISAWARDRNTSDLLGPLAALLTYLQSEGHVCLDLKSPPVIRDADTFREITLPPLRGMIDELKQCIPERVSTDGAPFVLQDDRYLYLSRYWHYEQDVRTSLLAMLQSDPLQVADIPEGLFEGQPLDSLQADAVTRALQSRFSIVAGGPGTGKTTIAVKILVAVLAGDPEARVALAAPTGKAAARMKESIAQNIESLKLRDQIRSKVMDLEAFTLHRVLGARYKSPYFKHDRDNPLPYDLLIVDESSMIDLPMMAKLLDAIGSQTRIVLIGDPDQLPPVEIGSIFGQLVGFSAVRPVVTTLTTNYRAKESPEIIALCRCINSGNTDQAIELLRKKTGQLQWKNISHGTDVDKLVGRASSRYSELLRKHDSDDSARLVLQGINQFRVLTSLRKGPFGAESINSRIKSLLGPGRELILVTRNDAENRIFNGDIGILISESGHKAAWIEGRSSPISSLRIPDYQTAYAMTGHKAQGSEFDEVHIVLPTDVHCPLLTREWLYTAVSRARKSVTIWASEASLRKCLGTCVKRSSGMNL